MPHECSFYCHGDTHAGRLLTLPSLTREQLLFDLGDSPPPGVQILDVFPAREVDVDAWRKGNDFVAWHKQGTRITYTATETAADMFTAPWIVILRYV